ncbi:ABC transporter ATP-binding protein [Streptomyces sp. NPDC048172]|uniref:ABC transporter ATP-binding protein n=1 Tax=Streptomyces sp. NPDC048172 TaxID=3365505 RepID=UPI003717DB2E
MPAQPEKPAVTDTKTAPDTKTPKLPARETWRALYAHIRPRRGAIALGGLLTLVGSVTGLIQPLAAKELVDRLGEGQGVGDVLILLTVLIVAGTVIESFGAYVLERTAESVVLAARRQLVARLVRLRMSAVDRVQPGDLMSRVTADTTLLQQVTTNALVSVVAGSLTLLATLAMMAFLDPVLLAVTVGVTVVIGAGLGFVYPRIARATERAQAAVGEISSSLERTLGALRTVKASGAEAREAATVDEAAVRAWRHGVRAAKWESVAYTSTGVAIQVSFLVVLGVGGARVASGAIPVSTLVAFLLALFYLTDPISRLVEAGSEYQEGSAAIARISEAERLETEPEETAGTVAAVSGPASLAFEDVTFRYRPELPPVHHEVTFTVPGDGGLTAFVGPSGAGKTTVFGLIERFYEPEAGRVLLDGRDLRAWPLSRLRSAIGYVEQDAPVLAGTLRENLLFAAPDADEDALRETLVRTRLADLVERLPDGLETVVGHRGSKLSGGERQRVAIARALLRRPRLLLLDEATSQLDAANELALREVVAEAARTTTVLVVAHRLSTVTAADRIVVMEAGRVRATGTHEELVAADPLYGELAATQLLTPGPGRV